MMERKDKNGIPYIEKIKTAGLTALTAALTALVIFTVIRLFFWNSSMTVKMSAAAFGCAIVALQSHPSPHIFGIFKLIGDPMVTLNMFIMSSISILGISIYMFAKLI